MPDLTITVPQDISRVVLDIQRGIPTPGESDDLATVPPAQSLRDAAGLVYTITADGKAAIGGTPIGNTSGVKQLKYCKHPQPLSLMPGVYQFNGAAWYGPVSPNTGGPELPGDPAIAVPPPVSGVPKPAADAGYRRRAFGPELILDQNWYKMDFYSDPNGQHVTQVGTGLRFAGGSNRFNAHACTMKKDGTGKVFGGGAYFEATLSWTGQYNANDGWPSWWANQIGMMRGDGDGIELDFMEWWSQTNFGTAVHHWFPNGGHVADGSSNDMPQGFNPAAEHRYGCLWVPATDAASGFVKMYIDDRVLKTTAWSKGDGSHWANTDTDSFAPILGSNSGNPMTVTRCDVFQR